MTSRFYYDDIGEKLKQEIERIVRDQYLPLAKANTELTLDIQESLLDFERRLAKLEAMFGKDPREEAVKELDILQRRIERLRGVLGP